MAAKNTKKRSTQAKAVPQGRSGKKRGVSRTLVAGILGAAFALVLVLEAVNLFNTPDAEKFLTAQLVGQFNGTDQDCGKFGAWDVAAAGGDRIAVTDQANGRILFFDRTGKYLRSWGKKGDGPEDLKEPSGIASGKNGEIYFVDAWKSQIIGLDSKDKVTLTVPLTHGFYGPRGVAFDGSSFYVADTGTHRVAKVTPQGEVTGSWGAGKMGSGKNELNNPRSLKVDGQGKVYVADFENGRVQVLDPSGKFILAIKAGNKVADVAVDPSGRIFASSMDGGFVKVYSNDGKYLGSLRDAKGSDGLFRGVSGMGFTPDGVLLMSGGDQVIMVRVP